MLRLRFLRPASVIFWRSEPREEHTGARSGRQLLAAYCIEPMTLAGSSPSWRYSLSAVIKSFGYGSIAGDVVGYAPVIPVFSSMSLSTVGHEILSEQAVLSRSMLRPSSCVGSPGSVMSKRERSERETRSPTACRS